MNERTLDNSKISENMPKGSHKHILFDCDVCGRTVEQSYRNYLSQSDGKFCRSCRNKHTAGRLDVKEKQSQSSKNMWSNLEYRKHMSEVLAVECKKSWDSEKGKERKKKLSEDNPMYNKETAKKVSKKLSETTNSIISYINSMGYSYIKHSKIDGKIIVNYTCNSGHNVYQKLNDLRGGHRCSECFGSISQEEKEIREYIQTIFPEGDFIFNDRTIIYPLELDIVEKTQKIAIEYGGLYWHSEVSGEKNRKYHINKLISCLSAGYRLVTIFSDEWLNKKDIVKNRLKYLFQRSTDRIYARKCSIRSITTKEAIDFINTYHIQGYTGSNIKLGAIHNGEIVSVMTFSKGSISKGRASSEGVWELSRFCSKGNVIGIANKFLKFFENNYTWNEIYSYADRRWNTGKVYETIGFIFDGYTDPNYWYIKSDDRTKRTHRFNFRKDKIKHLGKEWQSEWAIMQEQGYDRIWDCGSIRFEKKNEHPINNDI